MATCDKRVNLNRSLLSQIINCIDQRSRGNHSYRTAHGASPLSRLPCHPRSHFNHQAHRHRMPLPFFPRTKPSLLARFSPACACTDITANRTTTRPETPQHLSKTQRVHMMRKITIIIIISRTRTSQIISRHLPSEMKTNIAQCTTQRTRRPTLLCESISRTTCRRFHLPC